LNRSHRLSLGHVGEVMVIVPCGCMARGIWLDRMVVEGLGLGLIAVGSTADAGKEIKNIAIPRNRIFNFWPGFRVFTFFLHVCQRFSIKEIKSAKVLHFARFFKYI
jgi:hypothetical protein